MTLWSKVAEAAVTATEAANGSFSAALRRLVGDKSDGNRDPQNDVRFTIALIALCAKIARSDGAVTVDEVEAFRRLVDVAPEDEADVRRVFDLAKQDIAGFEEYARQIGRFFTDRTDLRRDVLEALCVVAAADGVLHEKEDRFLTIVASHLKLGDSELEHIRSLFLVGSTSPYQVLGLAPSATDQELKTAYRRLVIAHHPDRMRGDGLPEEMIGLADKKLAAINSAYDALAKERGL